MVGRSVDEDYRHITLDPRQAAVWSAMDHGANFVDLAGPSEMPAPKEEKADEEEADEYDSYQGKGGTSPAKLFRSSQGKGCTSPDNLSRSIQGKGGTSPGNLSRSSQGKGGTSPANLSRSSQGKGGTSPANLSRRSQGKGGTCPANLFRNSHGKGGTSPANLSRSSQGKGGTSPANLSRSSQGKGCTSPAKLFRSSQVKGGTSPANLFHCSTNQDPTAPAKHFRISNIKGHPPPAKLSHHNSRENFPSKMKLRQRSRLTWIRLGDANSKLFHSRANGRRCKVHIQTLNTASGAAITKEDKEEVMLAHFKRILGTKAARHVNLDWEGLHYPTHDLSELNVPFSKEEIKDAVFSLPSIKAPGPDGFIGAFFKSCWDIIHQDISTAIIHMANLRGVCATIINSANIIIIPKKPDAASVSDYRPISLIHSLSKVFSKLLANKLAPVLPNIVSKCQSAFVKKRSIHDNFLHVQNLIK
ncbi:hypothetical protein QYE76_014764 [Lolium multiflorum]|uniref:Reverse transcriptase domain-containing protein n=1 Tax=Lolium multiflorum TaxID=4521 RepID=A0AAD8U5G6_LOLMU|nr:hypothetical protein QYE76_014764 [Lolium multiflorum]